MVLDAILPQLLQSDLLQPLLYNDSVPPYTTKTSTTITTYVSISLVVLCIKHDNGTPTRLASRESRGGAVVGVFDGRLKVL